MSKKLKELRQRQHDLKTEGNALLDAGDTDKRELTETEETRFGEIEAELKTLDTQIAVEERNQERRRSLESTARVPARHIISNEPNPATTSGFHNIADFGRAVHRACAPGGYIDPRLPTRTAAAIQAAPTGYMEGGGSAGEGFELPVAYRDELWLLIFDMNDLLTEVDVEPTSARQVDWTADETTPWGASGVQAPASCKRCRRPTIKSRSVTSPLSGRLFA